MPELANSRQEAFAQARFRGMSVMEAYRVAGYAGTCPQVASKVSQHPDVKARLMELHNAAATTVAYERMDAIRDLVAIIKARPSEASGQHPLCEVRTGRGGTFHRFPSKLRALARLAKILGWDQPPAPADQDEGKRDRVTEILLKARREGRLDAVTLGCDAEEAAEEAALESATDETPLSSRQESFAQARFRGLGVRDAYQAAGYIGDPERRASRVNQHPAIRARIAKLRKEAEEALPYKRHEAINDLIAIVQASPSEAGPENPLCESRMGHAGVYHRFPCKLTALTLLVRLQRWEGPQRCIIEFPGNKMDNLDRLQAWVQARYEAHEKREAEKLAG